MKERIMASGSYDMALCIIGEYVNITSIDDDEDEDDSEDDYYGKDDDYDEDDEPDYDEDEGMGGM